MIKRNKVKFIISSAVILLPSLLGLILWNTLKEQMVKNYHTSGSGLLAVYVLLPVIIFALNTVLMIVTDKDHKEREQSEKVVNIIFWICPILSIFCAFVMYLTIFDLGLRLTSILFAALGGMLMIMGNYLPKVRQNRTFGIKIRWAIANKENWERTHRFAGKLWFVIGVVMLFGIFLPIEAVPYVLVAMIFAVAVPPAVYSYTFYKKQIENGEATEQDYRLSGSKSTVIVGVIILVAVVALLAVFLTVGEIEAEIDGDKLTVDGTFWDDAEIEISDIKSVEYRESVKSGMKVNGLNSPKILCGWFESKELGRYVRYSYTGQKECVMIKTEKATFVIGLEDEKTTKAFYDELIAKVGSVQ